MLAGPDGRRAAPRRQRARRRPLRALHARRARPASPRTRRPQLLAAGAPATDPLLAALERAGDLPYVDPVAMVSDAAGGCASTRAVLDPFDVARRSIHGDLHFQNVLWDGEHGARAVLDLEFARAAPPDLDLDVFLRFCAFPSSSCRSAARRTRRPTTTPTCRSGCATTTRSCSTTRACSTGCGSTPSRFDVRDLLANPPRRR